MKCLRLDFFLDCVNPQSPSSPLYEPSLIPTSSLCTASDQNWSRRRPGNQASKSLCTEAISSHVSLPWPAAMEGYGFSYTAVPYSVKLLREKTFMNWSKIRFLRRNFCGLLAFAVPKNTTLPSFVEKIFTNSHKTTKFARKFSLLLKLTKDSTSNERTMLPCAALTPEKEVVSDVTCKSDTQHWPAHCTVLNYCIAENFWGNKWTWPPVPLTIAHSSLVKEALWVTC